MVLWFHQVVFIIFVIFNLLRVKGQKVPIGIVFEKNSDEIQSAFKFAMVQYAHSNRSKLEFALYVDIINTADAFKLSRLICTQFTRGVVTMMGAVTPDSFDTLHSFSNTFQIPFLTPHFPEKVLPSSSGLADHAVSMRPDYHKAVIDTINFYGWKTVIYIYDSHDGLLRLEQIYLTLQPGTASFRITNVKRVSNASEAVDFLASLEQMDRWSNKHVILDCNTRTAKDTLILHVRDVTLGRRNYHYFFSGLVLDDRWEKDIKEYNAVNVTGLRLVDPSRKVVKEFMDSWRLGAVSARAALMFDAVQVLIDSTIRLIRRKPDLMRVIARRYALINSTKPMECNTQNKELMPFDFGERLSRAIKKTDISGVTGRLRFSEDGQRRNFTLQVMEFHENMEMVKVATWYDNKGLIPVANNNLRPKVSFGSYDREKRYVVSTIQESPYVTMENANLVGFCVDLTRGLLTQLEITYEIRVVADGRYGNENPKVQGGWDGMIGELIREEADLVIAPLTVTMKREEVVEFSRPFLSFSEPNEPNEYKGIATMFGFFQPLSLEIWGSILCSIFGVGICLYIVARYSPYEWRILSRSNTGTSENIENGDNNVNDENEARTTLVNEFSFWNSMWFSLGSFMQQGNSISPRTASGRLISAVWWFFTFILVATYTANLTSHLTINRINEPRPFNKITHCPEDMYRAAGWFSFLVDQKYLDTDLATRPCNMLVSATQAGVKDFAVAFPKGSQLREGVNLALEHMKNVGELQALVRRWFLEPKCDKEIELHGKELTLNQVSGLFYILVGGLSFSLAIAFMEFMYHAKAESTRSNISFRQALMSRPGSNTIKQDQRQQRSARNEEGHRDWNRQSYAEFYADNQSLQEETEMGGSFSQV